MKKLTFCFLGIALAAIVYSITSAAQALNFSTVIAFSTQQGRLCFFDQSTGKLYVYDGEGKACLFQGQLKELGKPFEAVQKITPAPAIERPMKSGAKVTINDRGEKVVTLDGAQPSR